MSGKFSFSFDAIVDKVQTLADGGIKVSLLLSESAIPQAALFMECKRVGLALRIDCKTRDNSNVIQEGAKRKSKWTPPEEQGMDEDPGGGGEQNNHGDRWPEDSEEEGYS